ncbi:hypothetical protein P691DRAFT_787229 [Macrolepiota fuliginosa MF-IS2]|uniref:Uncharacterized protein n=1 Tax=Macrolepiota fuliginosa MF-IS2 TaxID=1400762 RepID=A0A9P5XJA7_9AGAR|nr:hypothetical protein P691DRAFT_787229 [Macrolepiota fuliginosa MF-IS2]
MGSQTHGFIVGFAGLLYGTVGCGLSILTCIFGAALYRLFPELTAHPAPKIPIIAGGRQIRVPAQGLKPRQGRSSSRRPPPPLGISKSKFGLTKNQTIADVSSSGQAPPDGSRLRRVSSLDSFDHRHSFVLVAPVITINHVDYVDNVSIKAPTITIHPRQSEEHVSVGSKRRSLTLAHPPSLPDLPRPSPPTEGIRTGSAFRLPGLKPLWGGEKPKIHRSASSPQLSEFTEGEISFLDSRKDCKDKISFGLSEKSSKKTLRHEKSSNTLASQSSHSKFFPSFPKNAEKKRSQVLRTQPYDAPYFVCPPVPPMPSEDGGHGKEAKRSKTLPPEKLTRPPTAPLRFKLEKT